MSTDKSLNILVIEDNAQMAEITKDHIMQKFGNANVTVFNTGEEALSQTSASPDIIILDYQLDTQNPRALNGIQILGKLKKQFSAPVIFLSAQEKPEVSANIIKYGAYDYVVKNKDSFQRMEIIISNILSNRSQKEGNGTQKLFITALIVLVIILAGIIVWMKMS